MMTPRVQRSLLAIVISTVVNVLLMAAVSVYDFGKHPWPKFERVVNAWGWPGEVFATSLIPPGHSFAYLVGVPVVGFAFVVFFYALVLWLILEGPSQFRSSAAH